MTAHIHTCIHIVHARKLIFKLQFSPPPEGNMAQIKEVLVPVRSVALKAWTEVDVCGAFGSPVLSLESTAAPVKQTIFPTRNFKVDFFSIKECY